MARQKLPPLRELEFGELDAAQEAILSPELLNLGYFDYQNAAYRIAMREAWVLLGPKGAGKSAVLEHIRLRWAGHIDRYFTYWELDTFPVQDVTTIRVGRETVGQRAQAAWEFLLLLKVFASVERDPERGKDTEFLEACDQLRAAGYLGTDLRSVVVDLQKTSGEINFKIAKAGAEWAHRDATLVDVGGIMRTALAPLVLSSQHLLAMDGLDTFFFEGGAGWESLAGLIDALASLNRFFLEAALPISIVAALRSDHFDALNSQNSNKLKSRTVHLDWSRGGYGIRNQLWSIISRKATVQRPEVLDVPRQYLQNQMYRPAFPTVSEYLLSFTRLLPRDVVAVMDYLKQEHPGSSPVTEEHARDAIRRYAEEYFVGELMNNLSGVLEGSDAYGAVAFRDALRSAPNRFFDMRYLEEELEGVLTAEQIRRLLHRMFETGGIGISNRRSDGRRYTDFIFRRVSGAAFSPRMDYMLHDALTLAWNRPWR